MISTKRTMDTIQKTTTVNSEAAFIEEYKSLWAYLLTLLKIRVGIISICISIFAAVLVFSTRVSINIELGALLSAILLLSIMASLKITLAITRTIYRTDIYISKELEPRLGAHYITAWLEYIKVVKTDNMTTSILPVYLMLNVIALLFAILQFSPKELETFINKANYLKLIVPGGGLLLILLFIWNLKIALFGLFPKRIVKEMDKTWLTAVRKGTLE